MGVNDLRNTESIKHFFPSILLTEKRDYKLELAPLPRNHKFHTSMEEEEGKKV